MKRSIFLTCFLLYTLLYFEGGSAAGLRGGESNSAAFRTSYMGAHAQGARFVFILDFSCSMDADKLLVLREETSRVIAAMPRDNQVALICFSGQAFLPGAKGTVEPPHLSRRETPDPIHGGGEQLEWIQCTPGNKDKLAKQLHATQTSPGTDWRSPFHMAYALCPPPDAIFFVTDGPTRHPQEMVGLVQKHKYIQVNPIAYGYQHPDPIDKTLRNITN